jgi:hypothetical protein
MALPKGRLMGDAHIESRIKNPESSLHLYKQVFVISDSNNTFTFSPFLLLV